MNKKYEWDPSSPPLIEDHSLVKHQILQSYLEKYVRVLTSHYAQEVLKLSIVDGFCGGGQYVSGAGTRHVGSPIIAIRAVRAAEASLNVARKKPLSIDAEYHFVDADGSAIRMLRGALIEEGLGPDNDESILFHTSNFESILPDLIQHIKRRQPRTQRAIFVLDQYAYSDVPFRVIRSLFENLSHPEVILTFGSDLLLNYLTDSKQYKGILRTLGLTADQADMLSGLKNEGRGWKQKAQVGLSGPLLENSGAKFFTPFFIKSDKSRRAYWLVHLSNHVKARDVMTGLHWEMQNTFQHFGGAGLNMLGFDAALKSYENQFVFEFDQAANVLSKEALMIGLPNLLSANDGLQFRSLVIKIANQTPTTESQVAAALAALRDCKEVVIKTNEGRERDRTKKINQDDRLFIPHQDFWKFK